jgi:hypothetical protein
LIKQVVSQEGYALEWAAPYLRASKEIVRAAVTSTGHAFKFASRMLQENREFVLEMVTLNGKTFVWIPETFKADKEIVMAAVRHFGLYLGDASSALRGDKEVVLAAVTRDISKKGQALQWASEELRADKSVVLAAVTRRGKALRFASAECQGDKEVVLAAVAQRGSSVLRFASPELRADKDVVSAAERQDELMPQDGSEDFGTERDTGMLNGVPKGRTRQPAAVAEPGLSEQKMAQTKRPRIDGTLINLVTRAAGVTVIANTAIMSTDDETPAATIVKHTAVLLTLNLAPNLDFALTSDPARTPLIVEIKVDTTTETKATIESKGDDAIIIICDGNTNGTTTSVTAEGKICCLHIANGNALNGTLNVDGNSTYSQAERKRACIVNGTSADAQSGP